MRITIGKKLSFGFLIVIVVLLAGTIMGIYRMNLASSTLQNVAHRHLVLAVDGMAVRASFAEMVWNTKNILIRGNDLAETRKNLNAMDDRKKQLDRWNLLVAEHISSGEVEIPDSLKEHYTGFKRSLSEYIVAWDNALPAYTIKGPAAADRIMHDIEQKVGSYIYLLAMEFRRIASDELEDALNLSKSAIIITIITIIISAMVSIAASIILASRINRSVIHLKTAADEISHGNLDKPVRPISQDELGDLTASFERMRISFKKIVDRFEKNIL